MSSGHSLKPYRKKKTRQGEKTPGKGRAFSENKKRGEKLLKATTLGQAAVGQAKKTQTQNSSPRKGLCATQKNSPKRRQQQDEKA